MTDSWGNMNNSICDWSSSEESLFNNIQFAVRILVSVVSGLSLFCNIGIFCYYYFHAFKHAKQGSRGRLISISIACIAFADFLSSISQIQGVWTAYKDRTDKNLLLPKTQCGAQAILTVFGTLASFLWIDVLVVVVMVDSHAKSCLKVMGSQAGVMITQAVCWGLPLLTVVGLASADVLGFEEGIDIGWCFIDTTGRSIQDTILIFVFGRQLWAFLTIACLVFLPVCSCVYNSCCHERMHAPGEHQENQPLNPNLQEVKVHLNPYCCCGKIDKRLPIQCEYLTFGFILASGFMFLRLPNIIIDWFVTYDENYRCTQLYLVGLVFAAFGDSAIGLFNFFWIITYKMSCRKERVAAELIRQS